MTNRIDVFDAITQERKYQDRKWGTIEQHPHTVAEWILIMENQIQKAKQAWIEGGDKQALPYVQQAYTTGVACSEQHGIIERE